MSLRRYWYTKSNNGSDPYIAASYTRIIGTVGSCLPSGLNVCAIYAYGGSLNPDQDAFTTGTQLATYIQAATSVGTAQPTSGRKFVYVRPS